MRKMIIWGLIMTAAVNLFAGTVLISVELPTIENKKSWHQMNIPTYELIDKTAIAEADERQISLIKQKGYQLNIIDQQPDLTKYVIVFNIGRMPELAGTSIWQNDKTAIIKKLPKDVLKERKYKHQFRPMNTRPLGDRFWTSVTTKYVPLKSIPYDPFIQSLVDQVNADSITSYIQRLQDFITRISLTDSCYAASAWIKQKFEQWGYIAEFDSFYIDTIYAGSSGYDRNVIGIAAGEFAPDEVYIIGGHFDSMAPNAEGDAPGADDNASGTAGTMEIARIFKNLTPGPTIKFIGWAAEEYGMVGSKHYAQEAVINEENIGGLLNMDMIGYMDDLNIDCFALASGTFSMWLLELYYALAQTYAPDLIVVKEMSESGYYSDQLYFFLAGYSTLFCIETDSTEFNPNYHSAADLLFTLSPDLYKSVVQASTAFMAVIAVSPVSVKNITLNDPGNGSSLALEWDESPESDVVGYEVYWGPESENYVYSHYITGKEVHNDTLDGLPTNTRVYITIRAIDTDGYKSLIATEVIGMPVLLTLDQGVLVVDETNNWTLPTYPNDAKQDSFYNYILSDYNVTPYEYGSSLQKPILADFGPYSTIAWFADDYTTLLASGAVDDIKTYLDNGGKLWFAGWKATGDIRNSASYAADFVPGSFIYDYLKVSHVSLSASTDSFQAATGLLGYPSMAVDPVKVPISSWLGTMRYIESLTPVSPGEGIYAMDMKNDGSVFEGQVCAVRDSGKTVLFGFPLYFMDKDQAKAAAQQVMAEFGEPSGVATERQGDGEQKLAFKLYQNAPNPFTKFTVISYQLPKAGQVKLNVYNITGQLVKTLVNQEQPAGSYAVKWDGRDEQNRKTSAGVYIYHLTIGDKTQSRKMIVLK